MKEEYPLIIKLLIALVWILIVIIMFREGLNAVLDRSKDSHNKKTKQ